MRALFLGDVCPTQDNFELFREGNIAALFGDVLAIFEGNDVNMVNLECALTESEEPIRKIGPALKAPIETAEVLRRVGVTHCGLSNNHIFDFGRRGVRDSMRALDAAGILYTGFGENLEDAGRELCMTSGKMRLCVIAVCEHEYSYALASRMGAQPFDVFETPLAVRAAKEKYDRVVVLYHGGKEQCRYPSPRLRRACHAMAKSGADLILCQHSHCIGCYEQIQGCHILYGQGNFHFVKAAYANEPGWNECLAVRYDVESNEIELTAVMADVATGGIRLASEAEEHAIFTELEARNQSLADGSWIEGWRAFCESKREDYTRAAKKACVEEYGESGVQKFAHYLDCEAHLDVWQELFKTYNHSNEQ